MTNRSSAVMARRLPTDPGAPLFERGGGMSQRPPNRPAGFTAVMARRAPINPDDLDYFPTPPWGARAGGALIRMLDPLARTCWEPACGGGHMALPLREYFAEVSYSDIHDHGGALSPLNLVGDFLDPEFGREIDTDWIVSNPPFKIGAAFVAEARRRARRGVAMLLRTAFLESVKRYPLMSDLTLHAPFSERVPMVKGRWDPEASSATAYSWFIWMTDEALADSPAREAVWAAREFDFRAHLELHVPPGTKARLTRPDDAARFCGPDDDGGLFG